MGSNIYSEITERGRYLISLSLWHLGAIRIDLDKPFKLVSGNYSPIYINCRQAISDTLFMQLFTTFVCSLWREKGIQADVIAGSETAGIPYSAYLAHSLMLPMVYVRKGSKEHGIGNLIEGVFPNGSRVLLIDDVITDAGSKLNFSQSITQSGGIVEDVLVVFDREQGGAETLKDHGIQLHSLTNITTALQIGNEAGFLSVGEIDSVRNYLRDPKQWHEEKHLPFNKGA